MSEKISQLLQEHWKEHGFSPESTNLFFSRFEEAMLDNALVVNVKVIADDNDYLNEDG